MPRDNENVCRQSWIWPKSLEILKESYGFRLLKACRAVGRPDGSHFLKESLRNSGLAGCVAGLAGRPESEMNYPSEPQSFLLSLGTKNISFARVDSDSCSGSGARTLSDICPIDSDFRRPTSSGYRRRSVGLGPGPCSLGQRSVGHAWTRSPSRSDIAAADGARSDIDVRARVSDSDIPPPLSSTGQKGGCAPFDVCLKQESIS